MKSILPLLAASAALCLGFNAAAPAADEAEAPKPAAPEKKAIEWEEIIATPFAEKLAMAAAAGEKWAASPESIILEFAGPFISKEGEKAAQSRTIRISTKGEGIPKTLSVILTDDGLFDDETKTRRTKLALTRGEDGRWALRKAFRSSEKWPKPPAP
ncbi:MAG: hypothetical protein R3F11_13485 [Verrucomicrobiales bacterium]